MYIYICIYVCTSMYINIYIYVYIVSDTHLRDAHTLAGQDRHDVGRSWLSCQERPIGGIRFRV